MSLRIEDMFRKITLPKRYFSDTFVIYEKFQEEAEIFLKILDQCDAAEFCADKQALLHDKFQTVKEAAKLNIESINKIFSLYENADLKNAQDEFDRLMLRMNDDLFVSSIDYYVQIIDGEKRYLPRFRTTPGYRYFRVRPVEYEATDIQNNVDEMFHIPLSKRAHVNNERFSLAGFPSLYLSTMLPLAWQECGYPQKYYYSEYQYEHSYDSNYENRLLENELKFFALYSPDEINTWGTSVKYNYFELWMAVITRYLKTYPLTLACSFVNQSGKVPYKQEYVIPQMLMQWVQRNNSIVQGISYFTCIDTSTYIASWCAYNIVIPATAPYDDKKYSIKLREQFCWTKPRFYSVPLADKKNNEEDRKIIYDFISDVLGVMRTYRFPTEIYNYLNNIISVSGCLLCLLENGNSLNMQLALHTLDSLKKNCTQMSREQLKNTITEALSDTSDFAKDNLNADEIYDTLKKLISRFLGQNGPTCSIQELIDRYKWISWNDSHPHSQAILLYYDSSEIARPLKFFHDNHILHYIKRLKADDDTVKYLKEIADKAEIPLEVFFDVPVKNDDWIKENINNIKTPIIVKQNDVGIYLPSDTKFYEFVQIGFNERKTKDMFNM